MCVVGSVDAQLHRNNLVHVSSLSLLFIIMYQLITFDTRNHMFIKNFK